MYNTKKEELIKVLKERVEKGLCPICDKVPVDPRVVTDANLGEVFVCSSHDFTGKEKID